MNKHQLPYHPNVLRVTVQFISFSSFYGKVFKSPLQEARNQEYMVPITPTPTPNGGTHGLYQINILTLLVPFRGTPVPHQRSGRFFNTATEVIKSVGNFFFLQSVIIRVFQNLINSIYIRVHCHASGIMD